MKNENVVLAGLQSERRELKHNRADAFQDLQAAKRREAELAVTVERNGIRAQRPELEAARREIAALEAARREMDTAILKVEEALAAMGRRDALTARLQAEHGLTDTQREQLKSELEGGATESAVAKTAARLHVEAEREALKTASYSFQEAAAQSGGSVPW